MFEKVVAAPADPILGLTEAFRADTRSHKINLGVGIYKDETGATPILHCVKQAEQKLLTDEKTKNYLGIEGNIEYGRIVQQLLFGRDAALVTSGRAKTAQAPGGTGALRIAAEFVVRNNLAKTIWISDPTWANHVSVFQAAGLTVKWYKYYDAATKGLDFAAMQASLSDAQAGDLVLLHGCCHNPTGIDPTTGVPTGLRPLGNGPFSPNQEYGQARDPNIVSATDLQPHFQDEAAFGFQSKLGTCMQGVLAQSGAFIAMQRVAADNPFPVITLIQSVKLCQPICGYCACSAAISTVYPPAARKVNMARMSGEAICDGSRVTNSTGRPRVSDRAAAICRPDGSSEARSMRVLRTGSGSVSTAATNRPRSRRDNCCSGASAGSGNSKTPALMSARPPSMLS